MVSKTPEPLVGLWQLNERKQQDSNKASTRPMTSIQSLTKLALCAVFAVGFLSAAQAQDKKPDSKPDPAGTWTWTRPGRNGGADQKTTLKLKVEGDKVTGK